MQKPKAITGLHVQHLANEVMIYNEADGQAHALNPVAAAVLEQCTGAFDREQLVDAVGRVLDTPVDHDVVDLALNDLEDAGLIEAGAGAPRISRRSLIRKMGAGAAAAAALPIVESVVTPAAAGDLGSGPMATKYPYTMPPTEPPVTMFPTYAPTTLPPTPSPTKPVQTPPPTKPGDTLSPTKIPTTTIPPKP